MIAFPSMERTGYPSEADNWEIAIMEDLF